MVLPPIHTQTIKQKRTEKQTHTHKNKHTYVVSGGAGVAVKNLRGEVGIALTRLAARALSACACPVAPAAALTRPVQTGRVHLGGSKGRGRRKIIAERQHRGIKKAEEHSRREAKPGAPFWTSLRGRRSGGRTHSPRPGCRWLRPGRQAHSCRRTARARTHAPTASPHTHCTTAPHRCTSLRPMSPAPRPA